MIKALFKKLGEAIMRWSGSVRLWAVRGLGRTGYDYAAHVGDGRGNSIVVACMGWIQRTFPEAPLQVLETDTEGVEQPVPGHNLALRLAKPNPYYSGRILWRAMLNDLVATGNAYWLKVRGRHLEVTELWWIPQELMAPRWPDDGSAYISHYEYIVNGERHRYDPANVVHFRQGLDPENTRLGLSDLACLAREVFTDDEAANWSASLLRNGGVPSVIIAPDDDETEIDQEGADAIKASYMNTFGGDRTGSPMVLSARAKVTPVAFNPAQMNLEALRKMPEARVSAVLGIPAAVVGLSSGLEQTKVGATMRELREMAYESNIIPLQTVIAETLDLQLLPDFATNETQRCAFDNALVRVLQEDQDTLFERLTRGVDSGWVKVAEAKSAVGLPVEDGDDVYLRKLNMVAIGVDGLAVDIEPTPETEPDTDSDPIEDPDEDPEENTPAKGRKSGTPGLDLTGAPLRDVRLIRGFQRTRSAVEVAMSAALVKALQKLARDVVARGESRKGKKDAADPVEWPDTWEIVVEGGGMVDAVIPPDVANQITDVAQQYWSLVMQSTFALIEETLGVPVGVNLNDPVAMDLIRQGGQLIQADQQTRDAVMAALLAAREDGDGAEAMARRMRGYIEGRHMFPGMYQEAYESALARGLSEAAAIDAGDLAACQYRCETIARTETKLAQNLSSVMAYRYTDIVEAIRVYDGVDWDAECIAADGATWTFDEAEQNPLEHPRCVRNFAPIVRDSI